jgi:hypothetical protein
VSGITIVAPVAATVVQRQQTGYEMFAKTLIGQTSWSNAPVRQGADRGAALAGVAGRRWGHSP